MHCQFTSDMQLGRRVAYLEQQITLSVLHRRQGRDPSHLVFFIRHLSQALRTRLRTPSTLSCIEAGLGEADERLMVGAIGDMVT